MRWLKPSHPKTDFPCPVYHLLSLHLIPFPVLPLFLSGLGSTKEKGGGDGTRKDPAGPSQVQKLLHVPHLLFADKNKLSSPGPCPVSKSQLTQLMI